MNTSDELVEKYANAIYKAYEFVVGFSGGKSAEEEKEENGEKRAAAGSRDADHEKAVKKVEIKPVSPNHQDTLEPRLFFVYGSLRPDDTTNQPWRDDWLSGATTLAPATISGELYKGDYASVVLGKSSDVVRGFVVGFPVR